MSKKIIPVDVVIVGGGIAGLWTLNRLKSLGYNAILLESTALGSGQTIKSQGIIHGGLKYALQGILTGSANAVETMPTRWKNCLNGNGEIDLQKVNILSNYQLLWSTGSLGSEIASFFASKTLNSRVQKLKPEQYPTILQNKAFKGHVYRLEEVVLDTSSLIQTLATHHHDSIFKINQTDGCEFVIQKNNAEIEYLKINSGNHTVHISAKRYLFTAGEGNELLASHLPNLPAMQRRPLQMVYVKFKTNYLFFAHGIEGGINPRITITSHQARDGRTVWYLGGQIAEQGIHRTQAEQFVAASQELKSLFPWLELTGAEWGSFFVNRAEHAQSGGKRPENEFVGSVGNTLTAWPTKLALSPLLADNVIALLQKHEITPSNASTQLEEFSALEKPILASLPWDY